MTNSRGIILLALTGCIGGCGGGGSSTNFDALRSLYTSPTGTLESASDVRNASSQFSTKQAQGGSIPLGTQSLHAGTAEGVRPQDITGSASLSCPGGGSLSESGLSTSSAGEQAQISYNSCVYTSGSVTDTINGSLSFADYTSPKEIEIFSGSLTVTVSPPGTTESVNLDFAMVDAVMTFSVSVGNGTVLVSDKGSWDETAGSGTIAITDRTTTWTCTLEGGKGSCTAAGHRTIEL